MMSLWSSLASSCSFRHFISQVCTRAHFCPEKGRSRTASHLFTRACCILKRIELDVPVCLANAPTIQCKYPHRNKPEKDILKGNDRCTWFLFIYGTRDNFQNFPVQRSFRVERSDVIFLINSLPASINSTACQAFPRA